MDDRRYGVKSIFLATDDDDTILETKNWPQFVWLFQKNQDRGERKKRRWESTLKRGIFNNFLEAQSILTDMFLLAEGDLFLGKFTSNVDRIAFSLLTTKKRGLVPFISLDSSWCSDFGARVGVSKYGPFLC